MGNKVCFLKIPSKKFGFDVQWFTECDVGNKWPTLESLCMHTVNADRLTTTIKKLDQSKTSELLWTHPRKGGEKEKSDRQNLLKG